MKRHKFKQLCLSFVLPGYKAFNYFQSCYNLVYKLKLGFLGVNIFFSLQLKGVLMSYRVYRSIIISLYTDNIRLT